MIIPHNPYIAGNPVGGQDAFVGRAGQALSGFTGQLLADIARGFGEGLSGNR
ncbi:MAG: hypothetical protein R3A44_09680 [Caldilineaceae bacterium]